MLIKCFEQITTQNEGHRKGKQIQSRAFILEGNLDFLNDYEFDTQEFKDFKERCYIAASMPERKYNNILGSCDSHYELEILGLGKYTKRYVIVIDFADCLDIILAKLTGCSIEAVRELDDYAKVSKDMLTFKLEDSETVPLSSIIGLDQKIKTWFTSLIYANRNSDDSNDLKDTVYNVLYEFYSCVVSTLEDIKDYVAGSLSISTNTVYRSKSYSSIILTSDSPFPDDCITIEIASKGKIYKKDIKVYTLQKGEYAEKVGAGEIEYIR